MRSLSDTPILAVTLALTLALLPACGQAPAPEASVAGVPTDFGAQPQALGLEGAPARIVPPAGLWHVQTSHPGPERWTERYTRAPEGMVLEVATLPLADAEDPAPALSQLLDGFLRGLGVWGFGTPQRAVLRVLGAATAHAHFQCVVGELPTRGEARVMLVGRRWAFAVGLAPTSAPAGLHHTVADFVAGLRPAEPVFFGPRFEVAAAEAARVLMQPDGEPAITSADVHAVELVLEAGLGTRFPLATRDVIRAALAEETREGGAPSREAFRGVRAALGAAADLDPAERLSGMRGLGQKILAQIHERAREGWMPAARYAAAWHRLRSLALGSEADGLTLSDVQCLHELAAFLASVAYDRLVPAGRERGDALRQALAEGWEELAAEERAALRQVGTRWAELRRAWDLATPAARSGFRLAVLAWLAREDEREQVLALADDDALMAWIEARAPEDAGAAVLRAALAPSAERAALSARLGVEPAAFEVGW